MSKIPTQYVINKFLSYSIDPTHRKSDNTYNAGCPVCREGKSLGKKKRLFFYPESNTFHCFNCSKTWSAFKWISKVCGMSKDEIDSEISTNDNFINIDKRLIGVLSENKKQLPDLPHDSINLFDELQVKYYSTNSNFNNALKYIKSRRIFTAINRPNNLYISLSDFLHKNRLCIPFYDRNKKIVFYQTRSLDNSNPKYLGKSGYEKTIFNLDKLDSSFPYIFIFEGPIDSMFVKNGVSTAGLNLTKSQNVQLSEFPLHKRIWVLDNPMVDESARNKIEELLEKGESVFRWNIGSYKDFNEMAMFEELDEIKSDFILNSLY
jgi:DNA primase